MVEKEYIERKKLKQAFSTDTQNIRSWDVDLFDLLMIVIDEAPAADVVEVVRCKDCEYASYWYGNDNLKNTTYLCLFAEDEGVKTFADDFCSRGKRRE